MSAPLAILPLPENHDTSSVVKQQAVTSPMSNIPTDILLAIFETLTLSWDAVQNIPILLSSVCMRWHDCVVNSPILWSTIRLFGFLDLTTFFFDHEIKRINVFLRRSQDCPLTIDLALYSYLRHEGEDNVYADHLPDFHAKLQDLSHTLGQHAHRIKRLMLVIDEYKSTISILSGLKNVPMPMLTHWDVRNVYDESWNLEEDLEDEEVDADSGLLHSRETSEERWMYLYPNLRSVSLHAIPHHWSRFSPSNLVILEIKMVPAKWRPSASTLARILRTNAHSLEKLMLSVALPSGTYLGEVITLPNLESIELGFMHTSEVIPFINAIKVPNLRVLILSDNRRQDLHPTDRQNDPDFDPGITDLFAVIASRFPLHQLTGITLRHIALCPTPSPSAEVLSNRMDIAVDFFCRLENLNYLTVSDSDLVTLDALNRVQMHVDPQRPKSSVPNLTFLQIMETGYKILQGFLLQRLSSSKVYKTLDTLVITMPNSWYQALKWDTLNTKKLAQEVLPLVSRHSVDAEQLAAM